MGWRDLKEDVEDLFQDLSNEERVDERMDERRSYMQSTNARYQAEHMDRLRNQGYRPRHGKGRGHRFVPTPTQQKIVDDPLVPAEQLAIALGCSRITAYRLRRTKT